MRMYQGFAQPAVAFGGLTPFALASTFVVSGAYAGPGGQVAMGGELVHINADLDDNGLDCFSIQPHDGVEQLHLVLERDRAYGYLLGMSQ
jgi:hypothetical protein